MFTLTCKEPYVNANAAMQKMLTLTLRRSNAPAASVIGVVQRTGSPYPPTVEIRGIPYSGNQGGIPYSGNQGGYPSQRSENNPKATVEIKVKLSLDPPDKNTYKSPRDTENHLVERETE